MPERNTRRKVEITSRQVLKAFMLLATSSAGLNQISVAQGEAAIAATDIHNRLRLMEGK
jgi:hypothetical protein